MLISWDSIIVVCRWRRLHGGLRPDLHWEGSELTKPLSSIKVELVYACSDIPPNIPRYSFIRLIVWHKMLVIIITDHTAGIVIKIFLNCASQLMGL